MKIKKVINVSLNILFYFLLAFMIYFSFKVVTTTRRGEQPVILGHKFYVVLTGSMEPNISPGDLIVVKNVNATDINVGDVITFKNENIDTCTTHRVKEVIDTEESISFITKGDANNIEDGKPVKAENVQGRLVKVIPNAGEKVEFIKSHIIVIISIILASFLLVFVISNLVKELKKSNEK